MHRLLQQTDASIVGCKTATTKCFAISIRVPNDAFQSLAKMSPGLLQDLEEARQAVSKPPGASEAPEFTGGCDQVKLLATSLIRFFGKTIVC